MAIDDVELTATPLPACPATTTLTATNLSTSSVQLNWVAGGDEEEWEVSVVPAGDPEPTSGTIVDVTNYIATDLTFGASYDAYVRAICETNSVSTWATITFPMQYCAAGPTSADDSDLFRVQITGPGVSFDHNVGCTGITGAQNFTGLRAIELTQGIEYTMTLTMGQCGTGTYTNVAKAWIDWDQDVDFDEPAERLGVVQGDASPAGVEYTFNFVVPFGANLGETRLQVMQYETSTQALVLPCASYSWGSVHDYAIEVLAGSATTLTWYNLQWPGSANIAVFDNETIFAQTWEDSVTGQGVDNPDILVWIGYSTTDATDVTDFESASWSWVPAMYNAAHVSNNDEYMADIGADQGLAEGTYYFVSRFQYQGGPFTYGGYNVGGGGPWNGVDNVSGELTVSCPIYSIPWCENFDDLTAPAIPLCMTVTNDNVDAYQWETYAFNANSSPNAMAIRWNGTLAMDDWFFSPGLNLEGGVTYRVDFSYRAGIAIYPEALRVLWGSAPSAAGMDGGTTIWDENAIINTTYELGTGSFTPTTTGVYYVGWHGYSDANMYRIYVDDICVAEEEPDVPENRNIDGVANLDDCFDATNTITVTNSTVPNGSSAYFKAGVNIIFGDGFVVEAGAYMHAEITTVYCNPPALLSSIEETIEAVLPEIASPDAFFKVFPNPTTSTFKLELLGADEADINVEIYGMMGEKVFQDVLFGGSQYEFDLSNMPKGIYFIRVLMGDEMGIEKVIKQ